MEQAPVSKLKARRIAAVALPLSMLLVLLAFEVLERLPTGFVYVCPLYATTGFYCATCGASRATDALLHGNLAAAFDLNPLYVVSLPALAYVAVAGWLRLLPVRFRLPLPRHGLRFLAWVLVALVVYTVLRNLPWPAFSWLAP
jgi:hypothetical protein